jgi:predicted dehydrogenase
MMKVVVAGLGSIGQRHARNLRQLRGSAVEILAWRVRGRSVLIGGQLRDVEGQRPEDAYGLQPVSGLEEALAHKPELVIVANPTGMHLPTALEAVKAGCHVLIEKPLSHQWDGVDDLLRLVRQQGAVAAVGYQLRFHPGLRRVKQLLEEGAIGQVISAHLHVGESLPGMHPYEDYRESYAARKDQGGGVILTLSHELDLAQWFFGMPTSVYAQGGRLSRLEIDVEDTAMILLECEQAGRLVPVCVSLNFVQQPPSRFCDIVGERGTIHWDGHEGTVRRYDAQAGRWITEVAGPFERNQLFVDELAHVLSCIERRQAPLISVEEGAKTLRVALAALESLRTGQPVELAAEGIAGTHA